MFVHFPEMLDILSHYLTSHRFIVLALHQSTPASKREVRFYINMSIITNTLVFVCKEVFSHQCSWFIGFVEIAMASFVLAPYPPTKTNRTTPTWISTLSCSFCLCASLRIVSVYPGPRGVYFLSYLTRHVFVSCLLFLCQLAVELFNISVDYRQILLVDTRLAGSLPLPSSASVIIQYDIEWNRVRLHHVRVLCQRLASHQDVICYV